MTTSDLFALGGRTILITGAAGNLGRELSRHLVEAGVRVLAVDIDIEGISTLAERCREGPGELIGFHADLGSAKSRISLGRQLSAVTDQLDGAVFAAAMVGTSSLDGWSVGFEEQSLDAWRSAIELNLTGPFHLSQQLLPFFRKSRSASIVNVGSIYGSMGPDWGLYKGLDMSSPAGYSVSKGGLAQLTRWLAATLAPEIRVNTVSPGGILRGQPEKFTERYTDKTPLQRMAREADLVGPVLFLLGTGSSYVTGQNLVVDGGISIV